MNNLAEVNESDKLIFRDTLNIFLFIFRVLFVFILFRIKLTIYENTEGNAVCVHTSISGKCDCSDQSKHDKEKSNLTKKQGYC